jgi:hypothetical protein
VARALEIHCSAIAFALGAWSLDDPHTDSSKHRIECRGELGFPVPDQELQAIRVILKSHQQVAYLLGYPLPGRVGGDPGQVHAPGAVLDKEQYVEEVQEDGLPRPPSGAG